MFHPILLGFACRRSYRREPALPLRRGIEISVMYRDITGVLALVVALVFVVQAIIGCRRADWENVRRKTRLISLLGVLMLIIAARMLGIGGQHGLTPIDFPVLWRLASGGILIVLAIGLWRYSRSKSA
jgi:hypothetical protein